MAIRKLNLSGHENAILTEMGYEDFPIQVDLRDPELTTKLNNWLEETVAIKGDDVVEMAPPGLAPLAILIVTLLHGKTGHFPSLRPLVRSSEGFIPQEEVQDLQEIRNDFARLNRKGMTSL